MKKAVIFLFALGLFLIGTTAKVQGQFDTTFIVKGVPFTMKYIKGGECKIGKPSNAQITSINTFYMAESEVTQELWEAVMGTNPSRFQKNALDFHWGKEDNKKRPVEQVSWNECQKFIEKLNEITGKVFRMPTYAEWEYAAKGGQNGKDFNYSGSNDINAVAWYDRTSGWSEITGKTSISLRTQKVMQKEPNVFGLYDMTGNVREWCKENENGVGVTRGGAFNSSPKGCEVWENKVFNLNSTDSEVGLRLVMSK